MEAGTECSDFHSLTMVKKLIAVSKIITEHVTPVLSADGGNIELVDLTFDKEVSSEDSPIFVIVRYQGHCASCPSAETHTLQFIERTLRDKLRCENIIVRAVP